MSHFDSPDGPIRFLLTRWRGHVRCCPVSAAPVPRLRMIQADVRIGTMDEALLEAD